MVMGETGTGKTFLASRILSRRDYIISLKSKADKTEIPGRIIRYARDMADVKEKTFTLYPQYYRQAWEFYQALEAVWKQNHWTVYIDELYYLETQLKLGRWINRLLTQGRSKGITVVTGVQRPAFVSRFAITQSTHVISFQQDGDDAKRIAQSTSERLKNAIGNLGKHEFIWYYRPERKMVKGKAQNLQDGKWEVVG